MRNQGLRILLLSNLFLPHAGGSRVMYYNLFKRLAAAGDTVTVVTAKVPGWREFDAAEQSEAFRIRRRFRPPHNHGWRQIPRMIGPVLYAMWRVLRARPQVLHCGDLFPIGLVAVLWRKVLRTPLVVYCHGENITQTDNYRFQPKIRNFIYASADIMVANGDFTAELLKRNGIPEARIRRITPGLDASVFFPQPPDEELRRKYGISDERVVMTVSRLDPRKGHDRVLRALAQLSGQVPPFKYVIVGRGDHENALRELADQLGLRDKVVFAGFVPGEDLNRHYNLADIMAMPNIDIEGNLEGFGMVFLEANAASKPVIGGRSGGTAEAVIEGETGFLVDPGDERGLEDALRTLLVDGDLRRRMGERGLARVRQEFDWDSRAEALRGINREMKDKRRPRRTTVPGAG